MQKIGFIMSILTAFQLCADERDFVPVYGGNGCPAGSAEFSFDDADSQISIKFDDYYAKAGGSSGQSFDRKSCAIAIPLSVPRGQKIALKSVEYQGKKTIPEGALASLSAEYFFAGSRGPVFNQNLNGPQKGPLDLRHELSQSELVWSPCGQNSTLRINSSLIADQSSQSEPVDIGVDRVNSRSGIKIKLITQACRP
jgi:hypothetical protein